MNHDELKSFARHVKLASTGGLLRTGARNVARGLTDGGMPGALAGAGIGAVTGAVRAEDPSQRGAAAFRGALAGGALGGAAGRFGRGVRDNQLLSPGLSTGGAVRQTLGDAGTAVKDFGKRQIHGFTGAYKDQLGNIGMASTANSNKKIHLERLRTADRVNNMGAKGDLATPMERLKSRITGKEAPTRAQAAASKLEGFESGLREEGIIGDQAIRAGITSIPGVAKGLVTNPRQTGKAMWDSSMGGSPVGAAMMVGAPVAFAAPDIAKGDESATGGLTVGQKLTRLGTEVGTGIATGGMAAIPQMATFSAGSALADRISGAHKARKAAEQ